MRWPLDVLSGSGLEMAEIIELEKKEYE